MPASSAAVPPRRNRVHTTTTLLALVVAIGACAEGPTESREAPPPPVFLTVNREYTGALEAGKEVSFVATGVPGNAMRVQLWAQSGRATDSLLLTVRADSNGPVVGTLSSVGTQAALNDRVLLIPSQGTAQRYVMTLRGADADDAGPYRIAFRTPSAEPELAPTRITVGDSVLVESLDSETDLDRFEFIADSGVQYVIAATFLTPRSAPMSLLVTSAAGDLLVDVFTVWQTKPFEQSSHLATTRRSGVHFITLGQSSILGNVGPGPVFDGRYKLWVYRLDPSPESRSGAIGINDTIADAIDYHADQDNYTFQANAGDDLRLDAWIGRAQSPPMVVQVVTPAVSSPDPISLGRTRARLDGDGITFRVPSTGTHRVIVRGGFLGLRDSVTTPYRLELRRINRAPETTFAARALTDSVIGETIPRSGDIDEFTLQIPARQIVTVRAAATMTDTGSFTLELDNGDPFAFRSTLLTFAAPTGTVSFEAGANSTTLTARMRANANTIGSYRLNFQPIDRAPEVAGASLPRNIFVTEPLAPVGDVDEFRFATVQGRSYNILIDNEPGSTGSVTAVAAAPLILGGSSIEGATGSFVSRTNDSVQVRMSGNLVGSYRIMAYEVDTLPELTPAAISIGDTIRTETIVRPGDIDNFTFTATEGSRFRISITPVNGHPEFRPFLQVYEGSRISTFINSQSGSPTEFTAPSTGTYRIRIQAGSEQYRDAGVGSYVFTLSAIP